jgi:hypothetical protein
MPEKEHSHQIRVLGYAHMLVSVIVALRGTPAKPMATDFQKVHARLDHVAMKRPTHLLCLALRQLALGERTKALERRQALKDRGLAVSANQVVHPRSGKL